MHIRGALAYPERGGGGGGRRGGSSDHLASFLGLPTVQFLITFCIMQKLERWQGLGTRLVIVIYSLIFIARPIEKNWSYLQDLIPKLREVRRPLTSFVACSCSLLYVPCDPIVNSSYMSHTRHAIHYILLLIC